MNNTLEFLKRLPKKDAEWFLEQKNHERGIRKWKDTVALVLQDFIETDLKDATGKEIEAALRRT